MPTEVPPWIVEDQRFRAAARETAYRRVLETIPTRYREMTWDTWKSGDPATESARQWQESSERTWSLLIFGKPGTGKTHLGLAVFRALIERMERDDLQSVKWHDAASLLTKIQASFGEGNEAADLVRRLGRASLLFLDDLGAEHATPWSRSTLAQILRDRYSWMLPTIVTTNGNRESLVKWDERVADRIWSADSTVVGRGGPSRRGAAA